MGWEWRRGGQSRAACFYPEFDPLLHTSLSLPGPSKGECLEVLFSECGIHAFGLPEGLNICLSINYVPGTVRAVINYNNNINLEHLLST